MIQGQLSIIRALTQPLCRGSSGALDNDTEDFNDIDAHSDGVDPCEFVEQRAATGSAGVPISCVRAISDEWLDSTSGMRTHRLFLQSPVSGASNRSVCLSVYDLRVWMKPVNSVLKGLWLGAFHVGVVLMGSEWSFSPGGLDCCSPGAHPGYVFREQVYLGETKLRRSAVGALLARMSSDWAEEAYTVSERNCASFASAFCAELGVRPVPAWVFGAAPAAASVLQRLVVALPRELPAEGLSMHNMHSGSPRIRGSLVTPPRAGAVSL